MTETSHQMQEEQASQLTPPAEERGVLPPPPPTYAAGGITPVEAHTVPDQRGCVASGCGYVMLGMGGCGLLTGIIIAALILLGYTSVNSLVDSVTGIFNLAPEPPRAVTTSTQSLLVGIQPLGQLVSVSTQLAKADLHVGIRQGALNACGFGASHVAQGTIEAGIDLSRITERDLVYDEARETYILTVPAPRLTGCYVNYIRQYDRSTTACNVDWDEARMLAQHTALIEFRDDAVEAGLLNRARLETQLVLGNFVYLVTGRPVEIHFHDEERPQMPASCDPQLPLGWSQDPITRRWSRDQ
jgi:hypothetical protein